MDLRFEVSSLDLRFRGERIWGFREILGCRGLKGFWDLKGLRTNMRVLKKAGRDSPQLI